MTDDVELAMHDVEKVDIGVESAQERAHAFVVAATLRIGVNVRCEPAFV